MLTTIRDDTWNVLDKQQKNQIRKDVSEWEIKFNGLSRIADSNVCVIHPDSKVHGANMGPTWGLSVPYGPHEPCYQGNKPCNHNLYIGIIIFHHIGNMQSTG